MDEDFDDKGKLKEVLQALQDLLKSKNEFDPSQESKKFKYSRRLKKDDSDSDSDDIPIDTQQSFFCFEEALLAANVKVSVNDVGPINFPIKENVIKKLIGKSKKAKFGKGTKTVLDTSYRDTQTIPAEKLTVDIDQDALEDLLQHLQEALNLEDHSRLEIHLYNMLIYGPGQFFKRHRDTEKVKNMIATLVMVLPSPHKGGDLLIQHHTLKHRFFGSKKHEIIKCIAFYSDCYHEVKEVIEGYRVALTYNVEIKSGPIPDLKTKTVDEKLKDAVNNYFEESGADMLVYFLDHQYTEHSLRWYMLKGADRICGPALLDVGKVEGYLPCLALVKYQETYPGDCENDKQKYTNLYFWVDEYNICLESKRIDVAQGKICFIKDIYEFSPYEREDEGHMGNWAGDVTELYRRSAVVLWRHSWAFFNSYKKEFNDLHQLTTQPGKQADLLKKIKENSDKFFTYAFWKDENVRKMGLEIMIYLNEKEMTSKILSKYKISEVLDLKKNELVSWISTNCDLETWKIIIKAWESNWNYVDDLIKYLLEFLLNYMNKADKDLEVAGYLLDQIANFFINPERLAKLANYIASYPYSKKQRNLEEDKKLISLLQISFELNKLDVENQLIKNTDIKCSIDNLEMFKEKLHPEQFARIAGDLLLNMANAALRKVKVGKYIYKSSDKDYIQEICTLLKTCGKVKNKTAEDKIFNHLMSDPTCTASFLADLFFKLKEVSADYVSDCTNFENHCLKKVQAEVEKLKNPKDYSLPINHPCNCQHCRQVQRFLASPSPQVTIPAAKTIRNHMESNINSFKYDVPITVEIIETGAPYKLVITKLPQLLQDRKNLMERLIEAKKIIPQIFLEGTEKIVKKEDDAPAAKKVKH